MWFKKNQTETLPAFRTQRYVIKNFGEKNEPIGKWFWPIGKWLPMNRRSNFNFAVASKSIVVDEPVIAGRSAFGFINY